MVAQQIIPAIRETVKLNEIGSGSPYKLEFAKKGTSGASFGFMQGDTNPQPDARNTLRAALAAAGEAQDFIDRILAALSRALPNGNPLSQPDTDTVNAALNAATGRPLVDAMDMRILQGLLDDVDACIASAATRDVSIEPLALLYIAPWINMTGAPNKLRSWLAGTAVNGLVSPTPTVRGADMATYLRTMKFYVDNPRNFQHLQDCVNGGARLLPAAQNDSTAATEGAQA
jgi:hypothetical protein